MYKLNLKERKILSYLELNGRIPYSQLAQKVGVTKQVIEYQLKKFEKDNIIQGYNAIIDINQLNQTLYVVYLKFINMTSKEEELFSEKINLHPNVVGIAKFEGNYDFGFALICDDNLKSNKIINEILKEKSEKIKEKNITLELQATYISKKMLYENSPNIIINTSEIREIQKIDNIDDIILKQLANNCRISLVNLGRLTSLSANGVKERIKKLEKNKIIIGYKTKINFEKLGYLHFRIFLNVKNFNDELFEKFKKYLQTQGNVESINIFISFEDFNFRYYVKDIHEHHAFITKLKDEFVENIVEINSIILFDWSKIIYATKKD